MIYVASVPELVQNNFRIIMQNRDGHMSNPIISPRLRQALETMSKNTFPEELTYEEMIESMDKLDRSLAANNNAN